jgi:predicted DNA-binding ribbon-helix-helix protein
MFGGLAMTTLTIRLSDELAQRLKLLARSRGLSINKLVSELSTSVLPSWDTENCFRAMAANGDVDKALAVVNL